MSAVPVFVLGLQRSGTTWLANCLGGHPRVAAVEAPEHRGVHESIFFSHFARAFGDLDDEENFRRFAEAFTTCDYFLLSGCDREAYVAARPHSYAAAFGWVMDDLATRSAATHWLEKSPDHTLLGPDLAALFPDARFVGIRRDAAALLRSRLWAFGRTPPGPVRRIPRVLRGAFSISLHTRALEHFCASCDRAVMVSYEDLRADTPGVLRRIGDFLGCGFAPEMLAERFAANTSFAGPARDKKRLTHLDRAVLKFAGAVARIVPWPLLAALHRKSPGQQDVDWPQWCWQMRDSSGSQP